MSTPYIRKSNYESVELDGEWIILNTEGYTITKLNEVGGFCWSLLSSSQTIDSMVQALLDQYKIADEAVEEDIESFLADMMECGLIQHAF
jgi:hypothetical protein